MYLRKGRDNRGLTGSESSSSCLGSPSASEGLASTKPVATPGTCSVGICAVEEAGG